MTDTITLPRAEAQQILDALYDDDDGMEASKILRAALAQQAEQVPDTGECFKSYGAMCSRCGHDEFVLPVAPKGGV